MFLKPNLLSFYRSTWLLLGILVAGILGCSESKTESVESESDESKAEDPQKPPRERIVTNDLESQLKAELDDAVSLLEKGDVVTFVDRYMPVEVLKEIRTQPEPIEEILKRVNADGQFQKEMLDKFRIMQKSQVTFLDEGKSLARLQMEYSDEELAPPKLNVNNPGDEKIPVTAGFAGDINEAIGGAIAALEAKEYQTFIENMFPESEMYLTTSDEKMQGLLLRLKEHPEMVERMLADLKTLQKLTPEMDSQQLTATFQLNDGTKQARTVRFQKFQTWRFANTAKEFRTQIHQQTQQKLAVTKAQSNTEWIRIRDHWRLSEFE